jgi:hypothetical protein
LGHKQTSRRARAMSALPLTIRKARLCTEVTILLVFVIISLVMLVLLVADQSFSKATIEWECLLAP